MTMKKLIAAAAFATVVVSPAFAQTIERRGPAQVDPAQSGQVYSQIEGQRRSVNRGYDVYERGQYVGSDPDPNIRLQLRREFDSLEGN